MTFWKLLCILDVQIIIPTTFRLGGLDAQMMSLLAEI
jgi:hypothetical protein